MLTLAAFIARVGGLVWRFGIRKVNAVIAYARKNWPAVQRMLAAQGLISTVQAILRLLGY